MSDETECRVALLVGVVVWAVLWTQLDDFRSTARTERCAALEEQRE